MDDTAKNVKPLTSPVACECVVRLPGLAPQVVAGDERWHDSLPLSVAYLHLKFFPFCAVVRLVILNSIFHHSPFFFLSEHLMQKQKQFDARALVTISELNPTEKQH